MCATKQDPVTRYLNELIAGIIGCGCTGFPVHPDLARVYLQMRNQLALSPDRLCARAKRQIAGGAQQSASGPADWSL
jgi:hypothetical protein